MSKLTKPLFLTPAYEHHCGSIRGNEYGQIPSSLLHLRHPWIAAPVMITLLPSDALVSPSMDWIKF